MISRTVHVPSRQRGFTLFEALLSLLLLTFVLYAAGKAIPLVLGPRAENVRFEEASALARTTLEQLARLLQNAAPNSVRTSTDGTCIEYMPTVSVTSYLGSLPIAGNGVSPATTLTFGAPVNVDASVKHAIVGAQTASEIYTSTSSASRASVTSLAAENATLNPAHTFLRTSPGTRVFLAADPKRVCRSASSLLLIEDSGLDTGAVALNTGAGTSALMAPNLAISDNLFTVTSLDGSNATLVQITLSMALGGETLTLKREVTLANAY